MTRGGVVEGRILDTADRPWEGWRVEVSEQDRRAETNEQGWFRIGYLAPGEAWVTIYRPRGSEQEPAARQRVKVLDGNITRIEVKVD
jgi:hypothetical protein